MDGLQDVRSQTEKDGVTLVLERSYADWEKLPETTQRQLQISGILPRFVDSRVDKSTADIEMSLDILSVVLSRPELGTIVLVGGDRDYLPILRRLKEAHKHIRICALSRTLSGDVREFADNYALATIWELDEAVGERRGDKVNDNAVIVSKPKPKPKPEAPKEVRPRHDPPLKPEPPPEPSRPTRPVSKPRKIKVALNVDLHEWHERYVKAMLEFMQTHEFSEIHLGPFIRWLNGSDHFELLGSRELRRILDELQASRVVTIEEREGQQGYPYSVAFLDWNHELVHRCT
jgi:hypothetical protein